VYLNANIPIIECYVRGNYLRDQKDSFDKYFACAIFGFSSIPNQVPLFHFMMEDGGLWWRAPISAFCKEPGVKELPLNELVMWDSFSYNVSVTTFYEIAGNKMQYISRRKVKRTGTYLFTIDWGPGDFNELDFGYSQHPDQHKCGHVLELDDGNYAIQPNNRLRVFDASTGSDPNEKPLINRLVNNRRWSVENSSKWITDEHEEGSYDYHFKELKDGKKHSK
jgi:hypothetical protein